MKKEIARLNDIIARGCMEENKYKFKKGRHPRILDGLGHKKGNKANGRKVVNGFACVKFEKGGSIGSRQSAQNAETPRPSAESPRSAPTDSPRKGPTRNPS